MNEPMDETLRAIAARIKRADYALSCGNEGECSRVLRGLLRVLPDPLQRHHEAAAGNSAVALKIVKG